ncbi:MAG: TatD family hydrolase [Heliobacteriaceae bacterium]|jgi:TatD DNase family protein|nr:TatD family hydrolase [Heliobacteriaceae bacterium]
MLTDTHSHLDMIKETGIEEVLRNAAEAGVEKIIIPSAGPENIPKVMELVNKYDNVFGLLGVHPSDAEKGYDENEFIRLAQNPKIKGIGEIGLDYYYDKASAQIQKDIFISLLKLANRLNLPVNVHDREAHEDTFEILQKYNKNSKVVLHCFSGNLNFAQKCVEAGYYLGIGGIVTFKNAKDLQEVAAKIPLEHILLETDAPFLAPVPYRGKENQPAYVKLAAQEIARLRGITFEEAARVTTSNAEFVFNI